MSWMYLGPTIINFWAKVQIIRNGLGLNGAVKDLYLHGFKLKKIEWRNDNPDTFSIFSLDF